MVKLKKTAPTDLDFPTERQVISHDHDLQMLRSEVAGLQ